MNIPSVDYLFASTHQVGYQVERKSRMCKRQSPDFKISIIPEHIAVSLAALGVEVGCGDVQSTRMNDVEVKSRA